MTEGSPTGFVENARGEYILDGKNQKRTFYRKFKLSSYPKHKYINSCNGGREGKQLLIGLSCLYSSLISVMRSSFWDYGSI